MKQRRRARGERNVYFSVQRRATHATVWPAPRAPLSLNGRPNLADCRDAELSADRAEGLVTSEVATEPSGPPGMRATEAGTARSLTSGIAITAGCAFVGLGLKDGMLGVAWPILRADFGQPLASL